MRVIERAAHQGGSLNIFSANSQFYGLFNGYCYGLNPSYDPEVNKPLWTIGPWWQGTGEGFSEIVLHASNDQKENCCSLLSVDNDVVMNVMLFFERSIHFR